MTSGNFWSVLPLFLTFCSPGPPVRLSYQPELATVPYPCSLNRRSCCRQTQDGCWEAEISDATSSSTLLRRFVEQERHLCVTVYRCPCFVPCPSPTLVHGQHSPRAFFAGFPFSAEILTMSAIYHRRIHRSCRTRRRVR
ncbi:hypothetical protein OH76DRAFT_220321 [Lentinus brumalis]|uniref:Secreted protein n=1 Tax=Lentinus brumalis TaxID=2498619 RepID=A0A371CM36_9APHY|nr:hypothetical protein OH76DRAFT_220321 [Polyporus brumalis]